MDFHRPAKANLTPADRRFAVEVDPDRALLDAGLYGAGQFVGQAADAAHRTSSASGVALFRALFGARPFDGSTMAELTGNVMSGQIKPPPHRTRFRPQSGASCGEGCPSRQTTVIRRWTPAGRSGAICASAHENSGRVRRRGGRITVALAGGSRGARPVVSRWCAAPIERFNGVLGGLGMETGPQEAAIGARFSTAGQSNLMFTSTGRSCFVGLGQHPEPRQLHHRDSYARQVRRRLVGHLQGRVRGHQLSRQSISPGCLTDACRA